MFNHVDGVGFTNLSHSPAGITSSYQSKDFFLSQFQTAPWKRNIDEQSLYNKHATTFFR